MNITESKLQVLRAIQRYAESLEPHGHPAMGDDEIRIQTAAMIHKIIREMEMPEDPADNPSPVVSRLSYGPAGKLIDSDGRVVCTMNIRGPLTLSEAFNYAEIFVNSVSERT